MDDGTLIARLNGPESDRVERKESRSDAGRVREAICAFANDLPGSGEPGVVFLGARDDGACVGLVITDRLLLQLADMEGDGNVVPLPSLVVQRRALGGCELAAVADDDRAEDPNLLAMLRHHRSLMPLAQEARKPVFHRKAADGALGAHATAVRGAFAKFRDLARRLADATGARLPPEPTEG